MSTPEIPESPQPTLYFWSPTQSSQRVTIPYIPQLFDKDFLEQLYPIAVTSKSPQSSATVNHTPTKDPNEEANKTKTKNGAPAFMSTDCAALDAFSTLDNNVKGNEVHTLLQKSWEEDPDTSIRIIWNLRSIHDGKASKFGFYRAFGWLYANHPKTAIANLPMLVERVIEKHLREKKARWPNSDYAESESLSEGGNAIAEPFIPVGRSHGYYKDLLNILSLAVTDELTQPNSNFPSIEAPRPLNTQANGAATANRRSIRKRAKTKGRIALGRDDFTRMTADAVFERQGAESETARLKRIETLNAASTRLNAKLINDPKFKALYIAIARIFAKALAEDTKLLRELAEQDLPAAKAADMEWKITMASKWAPSLGCSHDLITNIATAISLVMFSNGDFADLKKPIQVDAAVPVANAQTLRGYYRRWVISPLRQHAQIPEVKMSANEWKNIDYSRIASLSFTRNKSHFFKHDEDGLVEFIEDVSSGKKTISGATLLPHELVYEVLLLHERAARKSWEESLSKTSGKILDAQWDSLVRRMQESGSLSGSLAVVDVSKSMGRLEINPGTEKTDKKKPQSAFVPTIFPAVALGLLLTRLTDLPFHDRFITFSTNPGVTLLSGPDARLSDLVLNIDKTVVTVTYQYFIATTFQWAPGVPTNTNDSQPLRWQPMDNQVNSFGYQVRPVGRPIYTMSRPIRPKCDPVHPVHPSGPQAQAPPRQRPRPAACSCHCCTGCRAGLRPKPVIMVRRKVVRTYNWGGNTDFNAAFMKLILPKAIELGVEGGDTVRQLFVFSDMQFDKGAGGEGHWDPVKKEWMPSDASGEGLTNHEAIKKAYEAAGLDAPDMVYWNLDGKLGCKPVTKDMGGTSMVSGFSGNSLKMFMGAEKISEVDEKREEGTGVGESQKMSPMEVMKKALWKKSYEGLKVLD